MLSIRRAWSLRVCFLRWRRHPPSKWKTQKRYINTAYRWHTCGIPATTTQLLLGIWYTYIFFAGGTLDQHHPIFVSRLSKKVMALGREDVFCGIVMKHVFWAYSVCTCVPMATWQNGFQFTGIESLSSKYLREMESVCLRVMSFKANIFHFPPVVGWGTIFPK